MTAPGWYHAQGDPPGTTRYWDGSTWIGDPVASQPSAPVPGPPAGAGSHPPASGSQTNGPQVAAGVLSIISGVVVGVFALIFFLVTGIDFDMYDDFLDGAFIIVGLILTGIAALYLSAGIGSVQGKAWGKVMNIFVQSLATLIFFFGLVGADSSDRGGTAVPLIWSAIILVLAVIGKPWR